MTTRQIMLCTLAALLPGAVVLTWHFGMGVLLNIGIALTSALIIDAIVYRLRGKPWQLDTATLTSTVLLALCLPPLLPVWMLVLACTFALVFGKHLYGGTGNNVFNPAMVGYAMLIVSFPLAMSFWPAEAVNQPAYVLAAKSGWSAGFPAHDGVTAATPLDDYRFRQARTNQEYFTGDAQTGYERWFTINLAFLLGGLLLVYLKVVPWRLPAAYLGTLMLLSAVFYDGGSSASLGSPLFHLFTGATMMAAFFIITDPVTRPAYAGGLVPFAVGIAVVTFIIRTVGGYPEGVAFGVLLMNAVSPLIDTCFQSREVRHEVA